MLCFAYVIQLALKKLLDHIKILSTNNNIKKNWMKEYKKMTDLKNVKLKDNIPMTLTKVRFWDFL